MIDNHLISCVCECVYVCVWGGGVINVPLQRKVLLLPVHLLAVVTPVHGDTYYCKWYSPPLCKGHKLKWCSRNERTRSCYETRQVETVQHLVAGSNSSPKLE